MPAAAVPAAASVSIAASAAMNALFMETLPPSAADRRLRLTLES
jgi:hypothetical protein